MELVDRLLAKIPEDHPARAAVTAAGEALCVALKDFAALALTAAQQERKVAARRLRIFVTLLDQGAEIQQIAECYALLREHHTLVPWRACNDLLEALYGEDGEQLVKQIATKVVATKKRPSPPPVASWRKPRAPRR